MTLVSPLNTLVKLLTTMSVQLATSTLTKLPTVSSTTITNSCSSANLLNSFRSADLSSGFEGNSQNKAVIGRCSSGVPLEARMLSKRSDRACRSGVVPCPKK